MNSADHNPDVNPQWRPLFGYRRFQCADCGNEITAQTNHTGAIYPECIGKCRHITNPNTSQERVFRKQTKHVYLGDIQ